MTISPLASLSATRELLDEFGLATKHRFGQNFLIDNHVIERICELAELTGTERVLEVGPGIGTLTLALVQEAARVVSIEMDSALEPVLDAHAADYPNFRYLMGDALRVSPEHIVEAAGAPPTHFVANLPYNVAATIILDFFEKMPNLERAVVMVQKEVADRISAQPGSKDYGAYTVKLSLFAQVTGRFEVLLAASCQPRTSIPPWCGSIALGAKRRALLRAPALVPCRHNTAQMQRTSFPRCAEWSTRRSRSDARPSGIPWDQTGLPKMRSTPHSRPRVSRRPLVPRRSQPSDSLRLPRSLLAWAGCPSRERGAGKPMTSAPLSFAKTVKKKQRSFELPAPAAPLADTHAHLTCFWSKTPAEALARAARAGVRSLVTLWDPIADDFDSFPAFRAWLAEQLAAAREQAEREGASLDLFDNVRFLAGVHPYGALDFMSRESQVLCQLREALLIAVRGDRRDWSRLSLRRG